MVINGPPGTPVPAGTWWRTIRNQTAEDNYFAPSSPKSPCIRAGTPKSEGSASRTGSASSGNQRRNRPLSDVVGVEGDASPSRERVSTPAWAKITITVPPRRQDALFGMGRSQSLPAWHSELRPRHGAGQTVLEMDTPTSSATLRDGSSKFLTALRRHGEPHSWRTPDDGMYLMKNARPSPDRESSAPPAPVSSGFNNSGRQQMPDLGGRRQPRSPPTRIGGAGPHRSGY